MGATHVAFYDLEKQRFHRFLKNNFFDAENIQGLRWFDLEKVHEEGMTVLMKHQLLFSTGAGSYLNFIRPSFFYKWKHPSMITNAVIEASNRNGLLEKTGFQKLLFFLERLMCKHISLKLMDAIEPEQFFTFVKAIHESTVHSVQFILPYKEQWNREEVGHFIMRYPKIKWVIFESSPFESNLENRIFFFNQSLKPSFQKKADQFMVNLFLFSESQLHHNYFNRKLFIGPAGEVKNAPECDVVVGNIQELDQPEQLISLIKMPAFQKYWYVTKDRTEVCRDCEFRYMCMDSRIPYQRENGYWYHHQECNYNPYTGTWKAC
jgi:SPASM domain peptide maturase of grasp-with-spasm system